MKRIFYAVGAVALMFTAACKDGGTGPAPVPVLTSVTPGTAQVGSAELALTAVGTGFKRESQVLWKGAALTTTYVSRTELRAAVPAEMLEEGGTAAVSVSTPQPGGGTSAAQMVTVSYPAPSISAFSVDTATTGTSLTVIATGTGFTRGTRIVWGGLELPVTYRGPTEVSFQSHPPAEPGVVQVAVRNPQPGGGTSAGRPFTIYNPVPVITAMPAQGATAGRAGFTLTLHGTAFAPGATVTVNGQPRGATFVGSTRVQVPISSAEVAAPGTLAFRVVNGGPLERASAPVTLTVRALGAETAQVQRYRMPIRDLVWEGRTGRLYASIPSGAGALGNTVAAIDPATGAVTGSVFVGSGPFSMAVSDDGQFLYVGLTGAGAVRRVDLPALTAGLQWSLGDGLYPGDLAVVPGEPRKVAVSVRKRDISPSLVGVQLYADGVAQGVASQGHIGGDRIEFVESASTLFGIDVTSSAFSFFTMSVDGTGIRHTEETGGLFSGWYNDIVSAAGRLYGYDGTVVDAARREKLGRFAVVGGILTSLAADPATGRVFSLSENGIRVHDMNNFQILGNIPLTSVRATSANTKLVRWGVDGLAFMDDDELFIVRSPLVAP